MPWKFVTFERFNYFRGINSCSFLIEKINFVYHIIDLHSHNLRDGKFHQISSFHLNWRGLAALHKLYWGCCRFQLLSVHFIETSQRDYHHPLQWTGVGGHTGRCWRAWLWWQNRVLTCRWHRGGLWNPLVGLAGGGSRGGTVDGPDCDGWCRNAFRYWPEPVDCTASYQEKCPMKARQYGPSILLPKVTCGPLPLLLQMSVCRKPSAWIYLSKPHWVNEHNKSIIQNVFYYMNLAHIEEV